MLEYINSNYNKNPSINEVAGKLYSSGMYIGQKIKKETGNQRDQSEYDNCDLKRIYGIWLRAKGDEHRRFNIFSETPAYSRKPDRNIKKKHGQPLVPAGSQHGTDAFPERWTLDAAPHC